MCVCFGGARGGGILCNYANSRRPISYNRCKFLWRTGVRACDEETFVTWRKYCTDMRCTSRVEGTINNGPAIFQSITDDVLGGIKCAHAYVDN